ncbi:MAG: hypothetical protein JST50_01465 [Bacteroidetes bacterium]|jgi:hypothetical protein|nr:hypothetical protein [Bacteroidota bacterium]
MNAFRIIELTDGPEAAAEFKKYIDSLEMKPAVRDRLSVFDLNHPLYHHGFHPAFAQHMVQYGEGLKSEG